MTQLMERFGLTDLSAEDRVQLANELWDSVDDEVPYELTDAQKRELDRRMALYRANPEDVIPWEEVRARIPRKSEEGQGVDTITESERKEIDKRLETYDAAIERGLTWEEFKENLKREEWQPK